MRQQSGKKNKKVAAPKTTNKKEKLKPNIPHDILNEFLQDKILIKEIGNVYMIEDKYLWEKGDLIRYRINVWVEEKIVGRYCPKIYIKHSFFVHYSKKNKTITDHTIEQTIDIETMRKI